MIRFGVLLIAVVLLAVVAQAPTVAAQTPVAHPTRLVYVGDYSTSRLLAVDPISLKIVHNISLGPPATSRPTGICYNPASKELVVTEIGATNRGRVSIINPTNNSLVRIVLTGGATPRSCVYDPVLKSVLIADEGTDDLAVLNASDSIVSHVRVGQAPYAFAWDSASNTAFVVCAGNWALTHHPGAIYAVNGSSLSVVGSINLGNDSAPSGIAFDSVDNVVVANNYDQAWAVNATSLKLAKHFGVGPLSGGFPEVATYDPWVNEILIGGFTPVKLVNGSSLKYAGTISSTAGISYGLEVDPSSHVLYVAGTNILYIHDFGARTTRTVSISGSLLAVGTAY